MKLFTFPLSLVVLALLAGIITCNLFAQSSQTPGFAGASVDVKAPKTVAITMFDRLISDAVLFRDAQLTIIDNPADYSGYNAATTCQWSFYGIGPFAARVIFSYTPGQPGTAVSTPLGPTATRTSIVSGGCDWNPQKSTIEYGSCTLTGPVSTTYAASPTSCTNWGAYTPGKNAVRLVLWFNSTLTTHGQINFQMVTGYGATGHF